MKILFVHNNFPAQFKHLARALSRQTGVSVAAIGSPSARPMQGVKLHKYHLGEAASGAHPFARRFDLECRRAEQVLYSLSSLAGSGFVPDVIVAHPGWGETLPLRTFFPAARLLVYCEFFYRRRGSGHGLRSGVPERRPRRQRLASPEKCRDPARPLRLRPGLRADGVAAVDLSGRTEGQDRRGP